MAHIPASASGGDPRMRGVHRASVANQPALLGLPFVDGALMGDGEILLCLNQTTGTESGPWEMHAGAWNRPSWFAPGYASSGYLFLVTQGDQFARTQHLVMNAPGLDVVDANALNIRLIDGRWILKPPDPAAFAWGSDVGTSTADVIRGGESMVVPNNGGNNKIRCRDLAVPATPWTLTLRLRMGYPYIDGLWQFGLVHRNVAVSKCATLHRLSTGGAANLECSRYTQVPGAWDVWSVAWPFVGLTWTVDTWWFRLSDNGVNLTYSVAMDGTRFELLLTEARSVWYGGGLGPTRAGYFINCASGGWATRQITCDHLEWS
jgi:hypothetical protein